MGSASGALRMTASEKTGLPYGCFVESGIPAQNHGLWRQLLVASDFFSVFFGHVVRQADRIGRIHQSEMAQENPLFSLCSSNSSRVLQITARGASYLVATLAGPTLSGAVDVWVETGDVAGLANFFAELAALDEPWRGSRTWSSLEGDLELSASCTKLGAVTFQVNMSGMSGAPEEWRLSAGLATEFGQLGKLAAEAKELVAG